MSRLGLLAIFSYLACLPQLWGQPLIAAELPDPGGVAVSDGAATTEAQENVALQVAEQMSAYLTRGAVTNALNMPSISAEEAPLLTPFIKLADTLGSFVGQVTDSPIKKVEILYDGHVASMNTKALSSAVLAGLLRAQVSEVNMVSAPVSRSLLADVQSQVCFA